MLAQQASVAAAARGCLLHGAVLCCAVPLTQLAPLPPCHALTNPLHEPGGKHQPGQQVLKCKLDTCKKQRGCVCVEHAGDSSSRRWDTGGGGTQRRRCECGCILSRRLQPAALSCGEEQVPTGCISGYDLRRRSLATDGRMHMLCCLDLSLLRHTCVPRTAAAAAVVAHLGMHPFQTLHSFCRQLSC